MSLFLFTIFSIYSAVHVYVFLKVKAAFPFGMGAGFLLGVFMAVMTFAPILVRLLERHGYEYPARLTAYVGYSWMGIIFLFFCLSTVFDIYRLCISIAGFISSRHLASLVPSAKITFLVPASLALLTALYGYSDALNIREEKITIRSSKISDTLGRLRIAQISDVHLGIIVREARLKKIIRVIRYANPDILVSTGDLVDGQIDSLTGLAETLQEIKPRYGKYAIIGNHEFYAGLPHALEITKKAGFTMLRNEAVTSAGLINIAGIDDPTGRYFGLSRGIPEDELLSRLPKNTFTLLLKHQPAINQKSLGLFDLQLSGHTHNGQIFPFRYMVRLFFSHLTGWYALPRGSHLYVSRGTGTWGPPMRVLSSPEVTVIDIIHGG
ncbi:MAG TPA: metallophosphoesterase [Desulfomonilia bacterium]|nr:metallophosphoesterase [Desulfomonilia bacterium]